MKLEYRQLINANLPDTARVWIYQSNRLFSLQEALQIEAQLDEFTADWTSHGTPVPAAGYLFFGQFIVLIADETEATVSGCSTDKSVHFIQSLEQEYGVQLMDRTTLAFVVKDRLQLLPLPQLNYALEHGYIGPATLYFNNLVSNLAELKKDWIIPAGRSWLSKRHPALSISEPAV